MSRLRKNKVKLNRDNLSVEPCTVFSFCILENEQKLLFGVKNKKHFKCYIYRVRHLTFYPSAERIWLRIRLNNAEPSGPAIDLQKTQLLAKKMLQNVWENCVRILEEGKHRQFRIFVILWKKWKKLAKQCVHPRISIHRRSQQLNISETLRHWGEFYIKTLGMTPYKVQLIVQWVFASLIGPAMDLQKMPILAKKKNNLFRWSSFMAVK